MSTVIDLDTRGRAGLAKIAHGHTRYLATVEPDGTIVLEPAVVLTEAEAAYLRHPEIPAMVEQNRQQPENRVKRTPRPRD